MKSILRPLLPVILGVLGSHPSALAHGRCGNAPGYFQPTTGGDGQRYRSPSDRWFGISSVPVFIQQRGRTG